MIPWLENDQVQTMGARLDPVTKDAIDAEIERELAAAVAFAEASSFPEAAELHTHVYA